MSELLLVALGLASAPVRSPCLGLESYPAGSTWTYAGTRVGSQVGVGRIAMGAVRWTTTLVRTRAVATGHLLLVRGFVAELAWSDLGTTPHLSILACLSPTLWRLEFSTDSAAGYALDHWVDSLLGHAEPLLQEPLRDGALFGQDPPRNDLMYGWAVERLTAVSVLPSSCRASGPEAYRLTMRTLPDHQVVEWRAGVGITAYRYVHHGTPAGADVHLVRCRRGNSPVRGEDR